MKYFILLIVILGCTKEKIVVIPSNTENKEKISVKPSLNKVDLEYKKQMDLEKSNEKKKNDCLKAFSLKYKTDSSIRQEYSKLCQKKHNNGYCHDLSEEELSPLLNKICK